MPQLYIDEDAAYGHMLNQYLDKTYGNGKASGPDDKDPDWGREDDDED